MWLKKTARFIPIALVLCLYAYFFLNVHDLTDDAYIFLRYAKNFIEGKGLVFNVGERAEGYSSFLWVMPVSALMKAGIGPVLSVRVLGFVFGAGVIVMLFVLSKRVLGDEVPGVFHAVPGALLVSYRYFDYWCAQGLENPLYIFLLLCGMYFYLSEYSGGYKLIAPAIFGLLALTRPEGLAFFSITFLHRTITSRRRGLPLAENLTWALPFLAIFLPFIAWRYYYYGYPLPNTYYAKTSESMMQVTEGWRYIKNSVLSLGPVKYLVVALPFVPLFSRGRPRGYVYISIITLGGFFFILTSGGDIQPLYRFFLLHGAPMLIFVFYVSAAWIYATVKKQLDKTAVQPAMTFTGIAITTVLLFAMCGYGFASVTKEYNKRDVFVQMWCDMGKWIKKNTGPDAVIAVTTAGAIPFFSERTAIDMVGLNDGYIAHHPEYAIGETAQEKKYNTRYVLSRKPDIIVFRAGMWPRANCEIDLFNSPEFRENYMPLNVDIDEGIVTIFLRLPKPVEGREEGRRYLKGLGELWGYKMSDAYYADSLEYLNQAEYLGNINPNMVNHYFNAVIHEHLGQFDQALKELELEKNQNPLLPEIYELGSHICEKKGDIEGKDKWGKEYEYYKNMANSRNLD